MVKLSLPTDLTNEVAKALGLQVKEVEDLFVFEEDKQGFFYAKLKPKKFLDKPQFKTMCTLIRDLGGDSYLEGMKAWRVKGPCFKGEKSPEQPLVDQSVQHRIEHGVNQNVQKEPYALVFLPVKALLSMPFQARLKFEGPDFDELVESIKVHGVLEPILVRQKPSGLYEIAAGDRRARAAEKAGLLQVPSLIKNLSDEEALDICLIENLHRKDLSEEEKSRALAYYATSRKWNAQQIADHLHMSYSWVLKYLPDEFKAKEHQEAAKAGGEARAEGYRESQQSGTQRVPKSQETREPIGAAEPTATCPYCGDPLKSSDGVTYQDKVYHSDCADQVKAENEPGLIPESKVSVFEKEPESEEEKREPQPQKIDTGFQWECPECQAKFQLLHVKNRDGSVKHRLEAVG